MTSENAHEDLIVGGEVGNSAIAGADQQTQAEDAGDALRLEMLAEALGKGGIPSRLRADEDGRRCVRASHPRLPLSTELYAEWTDGQFWWLSEWGTRVCPADEVVSAVEYVWRLLAWGGENERPGGVGGNG